jgi:hypothetical protein
MPLLSNEKHERFHKLGPQDVSWGKEVEGKKTVVMSFSVTRSTIDNEQVSMQVPVFAEDSRETLEDRMGFAFSVVQDRLDEAAKAWEEAAQTAEKAKDE